MNEKAQNIYHSTTTLAPLNNPKPGSTNSNKHQQSQQSSRIKKIVTKSKSFVNAQQAPQTTTNASI